MKKLLLFVFAMILYLGSFAQISVTGGTGLAVSYTSFTKADGLFAAINGTAQTGNSIVVSITADVLDEDGSVFLNAGAWTSIGITPSGVRTISGTPATAGNPLINFNGADYVTINGLNDGVNSLTISNLATTSTSGTSTIKFMADATNNMIRNCSILGSGTMTLATNGGNIFISTGTTTGNDNITIANCKIGPAGANLPSKGIYGNGSTTNATIANNNVTIDNCEIFDYFLTSGCAGVYALAGNSDWTMNNNKVYQTATRTFTAAGTMYGLYFANSTYGNNIQITNNTIGYSNAAGTGTLTLTGAGFSGAFQGIFHNAMTTAALASNINNNIISDISLTSLAGAFYGIYNASGASSNTININDNNVKTITLITTTGTCYGIHWTSATNMTVTGNNVYGITRNGSGAIYGIFSGSSSVNENISNNNVYNLSQTGTSTGGLYGIYQNTATGTKTFQNNVIHDLTGAAGNSIYGITVGYGTTVAINNNTIYALASNGGTSGVVYGILSNTIAATMNIFRNKICDLSSTSTGPLVSGITIAGGVTRNVFNNMIGNLTASAASATDAIRGINITSTTALSNVNVYYNTIYISATSSGTNFGTSGIYHAASTTATTAALDLRNNIIVNSSTAKGTGFTVAYRINNTALANYASTSNNNYYFAGTPSPTSLIFYDGTNSDQTLTAFQTRVAPRDAASITSPAGPSFLSTTCSSADFLHINTATPTAIESGGGNIASYTTDFDGDLRFGDAGYTGTGTAPDIGGDEFNGSPLPLCANTPDPSTINGPAAVCTGTGTTLTLSTAYTTLGITYQWYSGTTLGGPYPNVLGTDATQATGNLTVPTYYICVITCSYSTLFYTTAEKAIGINILPTVTVAPTSALYCTPGGPPVTLTADGATTYTWSPTAGLTPTSGSPVSAAPASTTTYTVTGTDGNGCTNTATSVITVSTSVTVTATATPATICSGENSNLLATYSQSWNSGANSYSFSTATGTALQNMTGATNLLGPGLDVTSSTVTNIGFSFDYGGTVYTQFSVSCNGVFGFGSPAVTSADGNNSTTFPTIMPAWDDMHTCTNGNVQYLVNTSAGAGNSIFVVEWNYGNYAERAGTFTKTIQVWLYETTNQIKIVYGANTGAVLVSASVGIVSSGTSFNDVNTSTGLNNITTAQNANTVWPALGNTYIFTPPVPPTYTYLWSPTTFIPGGQEITANPTATNVTATTPYTVLVTSSLGCSSTGNTTVTVSAGAGIATQPLPVTICSGLTASFTVVATGPGLSYQWRKGGVDIPIGGNASAGTATLSLPNVSVSDADDYDVVVSSTCGSPVISDPVVLTVFQSPTVTVTPTSGGICNPGGSAVTLTAGGALSYTWSPTTGLTPTTGDVVSANPSSTTTYTVTGTDVNGCTNTATAIINVGSVFTATATATPSLICSGTNSQLNVTASSTSSSIMITEVTLYKTGTGATSPYPAFVVGQDLVEITNISGSPVDISGWLLYDYPSASSTASHPYTFPASTVIPASSVAVVCLGPGTDDPANRYYNTGGTSDSWSSGGLVGIVLKNGTSIVDAVGLNSGYTFAVATGVTATDWSGYASSPGGYAGTVRTAPVDNNLGTDWTSSGTVTQTIGTLNPGYTAPVSVASYLWTPATYITGQQGLQNPLATAVLATTEYTVLVTSTAGCTGSANVTVTISAGAAITGQPLPATKCAGQSASFTVVATGAALTYQWRKGGVDISVLDNPSAVTATLSLTNVTGADADNYDVVVTSPCGSPAISDAVALTVNPVPTAGASSNSPLCSGSTLNLTGTTDIGAGFSWTGPNSFASTDQNPSILNVTTAATGTYTFIATLNGCSSLSATTVVSISATPPTPTTTGYSLCTGGTIPSGQGLQSTSVGAPLITGSQTIYFDVATQPVEVNAAPGNIVSSATLAAIPAGSTVTGIVITYNGITALLNSWESDVRLGLSGALINAADMGAGTLNSAGTFNYTRTATTGITATITGGTVNLLYWDYVSDNTGVEATFPTGTAVASLVVNYSFPNPAAVLWYTTLTGGTSLASGTPFNPIGVDPLLPNSNTPGTWTYYAEVPNGSCASIRKSADLVIGSIPTVTITTVPGTSVCVGTEVTLSAVPLGGGLPYIYSWKVGGVEVSSSQSFAVTPSLTTTYDLTMTDNCSQVVTSSVTITVKPIPTAVASSNAPLCSGGTLLLTGNTDIGTLFSWTGPDGFTSSDLSPSIVSATTSASGTYIFTATLDGCSKTSPTNVLINPTPSFTINPAAATVQPGDIQQLTANPSNNYVTGYNNGPIVNSPGTGTGGMDESLVYTPLTLWGAGMQSGTNSVADDFTVTGGMWDVSSMEFLGYQSFSGTTSSITGIYVQVWNGNPTVAGSTVVWGDMTTNRMTSTSFANIYRGSVSGNTDRPVMKIIANTAGLSLMPGTYWVQFAASGSASYTGPWVPTITITGQNVTGNALQNAAGVWTSLLDGTYNQGVPFVVNGIISGSTTSVTWSPLTDLYTNAAATPGNEYTGGPATTVWSKPAATITYTATATTAVPCTSSQNVTITVAPSTKTLTVTAFLEGLYDGAGGMFEAQGLAGPEFPGYADQVTVELHNGVNYATIEYASGPANLSTAGVVTVNDIPSGLTGSYYITIKHRNSIETTSGAPVSFAVSPVSYDFTTASSQAYGDNMRLMGTVYAIWGGDVNLDGLVDSGDMNFVENASTAITFGYVVEDVNGDGLVDSGDMNIVENNSINIVGVITP